MSGRDWAIVGTLLGTWAYYSWTVFAWDTVSARILRSLPLWLAYSSVALVLDIIGLVIMVPLAGFQLWAVRASRVYVAEKGLSETGRMRAVTAWRGGWLTWLWGNEEDGVTGPTWWAARNGYPSTWYGLAWQSYRWSALRNPSNNMRFIPGINPVIWPADVHSWTWANATPWDARAFARPVLQEAIYTWQGVFSSIRLHIGYRGHQYRFWWGWKLKPEDAQGVPADDMRAPRCGFATQLKRIG